MPTAAAASKCIASLTYQQKGGDLGKLALPEDVPAEIQDCGGRACQVQADIKIVVQKDGSVAVEGVTMTSDSAVAPDVLSERMRRWLSGLHYDPPMLRGDPVCVRLEWIYGFAKTAPKNMKQPTP